MVDVERTGGQDRHITYFVRNVKNRPFWRSGLDGMIILNCIIQTERKHRAEDVTQWCDIRFNSL